MTTATLGTEVSVGYRSDQAAMASVSVSLAPDIGAESQEHATVRFRSIDPRNTRVADVSKKVLRRMQGFLIEMVGKEAKVAFMEAGATHEYYLPSSHLQRAGIKAENQPFQMDEVEIKTDAGCIIGYEFCPLAKPSDAFLDSFALDAERERKRNLIFKTFRHAQD